MSDKLLESAERFEAKLTSSDHFSWIRTRLSIERTQMAWIRTSTSLIGFGFTIVQFFERFSGMKDVSAPAFPEAPRYLGLALIAAGVIGAVGGILQYMTAVRYLWEAPFAPIAGLRSKHHSLPTLVAAIAVLLIGIFAFGAVAFRLT